MSQTPNCPDKNATFEQEAADFFPNAPDDHEEWQAFEAAGLEVWKRD